MVVPVSPGGGPPPPPPQQTSLRFRLLNIKVLLSGTAIVYQATKILDLDYLLLKNVYKIVKLLKKIFAFTNDPTFSFDLWQHKNRHALLKLCNSTFSVLSGLYDLATANEVTKVAYRALALGDNFQPFSNLAMDRIELFLQPTSLLKLATKVSHVWLEGERVWALDSSASYEKRRATWICFAKVSFDLGIESFRWGLYFVGLSSGATYWTMLTLSTLGILSNCLGLVKHLKIGQV